MYVNAKMIPVELFQESGKGMGEFKYNIFDT
jgi:hypothetical protein